MEMTRQRSLAASAALHLAVLASMLISWPWARDLKMGTVVPVNIVTNATTTDMRQAIQAPEEQAAATETPAPDAPLETVAPAPEPTPEPPRPVPTPKAAAPPPKPAPPTPAPKAPAPKAATPTPKPAAKPAEKQLDLDSLLAGLPKPKGGGRPSSAPKGPTRPETATQARPDFGSGANAAALQGLSDELQRRWNPNCEVEGGRSVRVQISFQIGQGGLVVPKSETASNSTDPLVVAAYDRAVRAIYAASPFRNLPRDFYGQRVKVNFDAAKACG
jgi:outer membrane biosynthesis protein TonB